MKKLPISYYIIGSMHEVSVEHDRVFSSISKIIISNDLYIRLIGETNNEKDRENLSRGKFCYFEISTDEKLKNNEILVEFYDNEKYPIIVNEAA